jgi:hypothetical protein
MIPVVVIAGLSLLLACGASVLIEAGHASDQPYSAPPTIIRIGIFY